MTDATDPATLQEGINRLAELKGAQASLLKQLSRSMMIQALWPEAFEHGSVKAHVLGNAFKPAACRFVMQRGDGSRRELPLCIVPRELWAHSRKLLNESARGQIKTWKE